MSTTDICRPQCSETSWPARPRRQREPRQMSAAPEVACCDSCHDEEEAGYLDFVVCCRLNHRHEFRPSSKYPAYCWCGGYADDDVHTVVGITESKGEP